MSSMWTVNSLLFFFFFVSIYRSENIPDNAICTLPKNRKFFERPFARKHFDTEIEKKKVFSIEWNTCLQQNEQHLTIKNEGKKRARVNERAEHETRDGTRTWHYWMWLHQRVPSIHETMRCTCRVHGTRTHSYSHVFVFDVVPHLLRISRHFTKNKIRKKNRTNWNDENVDGVDASTTTMMVNGRPNVWIQSSRRIENQKNFHNSRIIPDYILYGMHLTEKRGIRYGARVRSFSI